MPEHADPTVTGRVRAIFLHENEHVTIEDAAAMLGRTEADILASIEAGDIETITTCSGPRIDTRELAEQAAHMWPLQVIEEALGRDASMVMPAGLRSAKLAVRLWVRVELHLHVDHPARTTPRLRRKRTRAVHRARDGLCA